MRVFFSMTKPLAKWWLCLGVILFSPAVFSQGTEPSPDDFVYAEKEPVALNLAEVRKTIGYPQAAIQKNLEGTVVLRILVDDKGNYVKHKIIRTTDALFTEAVETHAPSLRFTPALSGGKPMMFWVNIPFNFKLVGSPEETARALVAELTSMIAKEPANHELFLKRGVQYLELGLADSAEHDFQKSLDLNPRKKGKKKNSFANVFFAQYGLGSALSAQEKWTSSVDAFTAALGALTLIPAPDSAVNATLNNVYIERGYARANLSLWEDAEKDYRFVLGKDSALDCTVYSLIQDVGLSSNNNATIVFALNGMIGCKPDDHLLLYSRGYYLSQGGEYQESLKDLRACLEKTTYPQIKIACHNRLAYVYTKSKQPELAQAELDASMKINALNPQSYYYLGLLDLERGKKDQACKNLNRAITFDLSGPELEECEKLIAETCK